MRSTIETNRLTLRPFEPGDAHAAFGWFGDPSVMQFTSTGPDSSMQQTQARIAKYQAHQAKHGFSKWIILDRATNVPMGDSGLLELEDYGWIDLGYRLAPPYWGRGFATEAASAWVKAAFQKLHLNRLGAFVHPENTASIRVLEKLGFREDRRGTVMGMKAIIFSLAADMPQWLKQSAELYS